MKYTRFALIAVVGFGLVSCNENEQAKPAKTSLFDSLQKSGTVTYSPNMNNQPGVANPGAPVPRPQLDLSGMTITGNPAAEKPPVEPSIQIPVDARWTLYCAAVAGPDRFGRIAQLKSALIAKSGLTDWYVIHNEANSTLFYGFYSSVEKNQRAGVMAHAQQKQIQDLRNDQGDRMFAACFFTPIVQPDPVAPAEWKLTNAPPKAYWSLQVAAFKDNPLRKQAAVELVKQFRSKGVEAYFHHGESISHVCIGAWPMDSVAKQDDDKGRTVSPEDDIMVSGEVLPDRFQKASLSGNDGHKIRSYAQRIEIIDPSLKATMAEYPEHVVNYETSSQKVKTTDGSLKRITAPSLLVVIPRNVETSALAGDGGMPGMLNQVGAPPPPQDPMHQPGTGRLRGLGN